MEEGKTVAQVLSYLADSQHYSELALDDLNIVVNWHLMIYSIRATFNWCFLREQLTDNLKMFSSWYLHTNTI